MGSDGRRAVPPGSLGFTTAGQRMSVPVGGLGQARGMDYAAMDVENLAFAQPRWGASRLWRG